MTQPSPLRRSRVALAPGMLVTLLAALPSGCGALPSLRELHSHRSAAVRGAASLGAGVGALVGVPVTVVALPLTLPVALEIDSACGAASVALTPVLVTAYVGSCLLAAVPWLLHALFASEDEVGAPAGVDEPAPRGEPPSTPAARTQGVEP